MDRERAGRSTRELASRRRKANIQILAIAIAALAILAALTLFSKPLGLGTGGALLFLVFAFAIKSCVEAESNRIEKMQRRAIRGARAEELVASILDNLGEGFLVLHDIPSPYGNIDHIVISQQSGIFLLETKAHGGRVSTLNGQLLVNGHPPEKDFVAQALRNTYWLREQIQSIVKTRAWIIPVIVFTNAFVQPGPPIKNVLIVNKKYLPVVLCRPMAKAQNSVIWDNREQIRKALYASQEAVVSKAAR